MSFGKRKRDEDEDPEILCAKKALEPFRYREGFTDAYLLVKGEKLWVNRALVASRSTYFRTLFEGVYKERDEQGVEIHEFPLEDVLMALSFSQVIGDRGPDLRWEEREQAFRVANAFGVDSLNEALTATVKRRRPCGQKDNWEWATFVVEHGMKHLYTELVIRLGDTLFFGLNTGKRRPLYLKFWDFAKADNDFLRCYTARHFIGLKEE